MLTKHSYVNIQSWMLTDLGLKGNKLIIYAIIFGFSQDGESCFNGSLNYLCKWTNSTKQGVLNSLHELLQDNLIIKIETDGLPEYKAVLNKSESTSNSSDNNSGSNIEEVLKKNKIKQVEKVAKQESAREIGIKIINYLNEKCGTRFRLTKDTLKHISARLNDGYSYEDFCKVIDNKWNDWGAHPVKFSNGHMSDSYLRPSTLFNNKFDEYLNQKISNYYSTNKRDNVREFANIMREEYQKAESVDVDDNSITF